MTGRKQKRRRNVLDYRQQGLFAFTLVLYVVTVNFFFLWTTLALNPSVEESVAEGLFLPSAMRQVLAYMADHPLVVLLTLLFAFGCALLFSHQIFGPIRRLENALRSKRENPDKPVACNLRGADYFQPFSRLLESVLNQGSEESRGELPQVKPKGT